MWYITHIPSCVHTYMQGYTFTCICRYRNTCKQLYIYNPSKQCVSIATDTLYTYPICICITYIIQLYVDILYNYKHLWYIFKVGHWVEVYNFIYIGMKTYFVCLIDHIWHQGTMPIAEYGYEFRQSHIWAWLI